MGSYLTSALSTAGTGLADAATAAGQQTGISNVASGLQSLFGGQSEAGRLQGLGQQVPAGVELLGPSETFQTPAATGGGFMQGLLDGFRGTMQQVPELAGSSQTGQGLGQFLAFLDRMNQRGGGSSLAPVVNLAGGGVRPVTTMAPGYRPAGEPRGLLTNLVSGYTGGILMGPIPQ